MYINFKIILLEVDFKKIEGWGIKMKDIRR